MVFRRLLFLTLLLLVGCGTPEPKKPTARQAVDKLSAELIVISEELIPIAEQAVAQGDPCFKSETRIAGMEMAASKLQAIYHLYEATGETKPAMQAKAMANGLSSDISEIKRSCR